MRRMRRRALMLAISFGLLSLCGLPREGAASPRFLPAEPPVIGDPDTPPSGPSHMLSIGELQFVWIQSQFGGVYVFWSRAAVSAQSPRPRRALIHE